MRISDWSSDVCSSDLATADHGAVVSGVERVEAAVGGDAAAVEQGGQAPAPAVAVDGDVFARDGGVVQQLLRALLSEVLVPRLFVDDVVARTDGSRFGNGCVISSRARGSRYHYNKQLQ